MVVTRTKNPAAVYLLLLTWGKPLGLSLRSMCTVYILVYWGCWDKVPEAGCFK